MILIPCLVIHENVFCIISWLMILWRFVKLFNQNSGRDAVPLFLRRAKLPKESTEMHQPGKVTKRTVLNVFGPTGQGGRYILDSLKTGAVHTEYYHDSDLVVGAIINVWGRKFTICGCDEFTQEYYRSKYGYDNFDAVDYKSQKDGPATRVMPPYNGFGSEEDSLCNCLSLIPKPPRRDFIKFMEKDRHGLESNVLRFVAKMDTQKPIEVDRRFTISYFLSDDTILVFEPPQRNSGIIGGKFLERGRVKKPDGGHYTAQDLFIGGNVQFCKHPFILIDADEYAINYMESHADEFPHANPQLVSNKIRRLLTDNASEVRLMLDSADRKKTGSMSFETFKKIVKKIGGENISAHEILTIARHFGDFHLRDEDFETLVASVQEQLRKVNYENFSLMNDACIYVDERKTGFIPLGELKNISKSFKLPIQDHLLEKLLYHTKSNGDGHLDYQHFISFLNWRDQPIISQKYLPGLAFGVETRKRQGPLDTLNEVAYNKIIDSLGIKI
uniref:EF-hand domain-containing family member C2 n=1 Tax=Clytia hemisphaerica TaxID=252671 RepID=A0A7M5VAV7_9CNID